jgi:hypothetical protein
LILRCYAALPDAAAISTRLPAFVHCWNTARQASLRLAFYRRRHAVMARTFGISPAQSR